MGCPMVIPQRTKYVVIMDPVANEEECGDQFLILDLPEYSLFAVADGLGHGPEAALASKTAIETIR